MATVSVITWIVGFLLCTTLTSKVVAAIGIRRDDEPDDIGIIVGVTMLWALASIGTGMALTYDIYGDVNHGKQIAVLGGLAGLGWCPITYFIVSHSRRLNIDRETSGPALEIVLYF